VHVHWWTCLRSALNTALPADGSAPALPAAPAFHRILEHIDYGQLGNLSPLPAQHLAPKLPPPPAQSAGDDGGRDGAKDLLPRAGAVAAALGQGGTTRIGIPNPIPVAPVPSLTSLSMWPPVGSQWRVMSDLGDF